MTVRDSKEVGLLLDGAGVSQGDSMQLVLHMLGKLQTGSSCC